MYGKDSGTGMLALLAAMWGGLGTRGYSQGYRDRLEGVDIDAEYELIKQKKSSLPRALRDRIVVMKAHETDKR